MNTVAPGLDHVLAELASRDAGVRAGAVRELGRCADPEFAGPRVAAMLDDSDELVRAEAADAIGVLEYRPALAKIRARLRDDPSPLVRASAAETLGDLGDTSAVAELEQALGDDDAAVRGFAASSLGLIGERACLGALEQRLACEEQTSVRAEIQGARYRLGARDASAALLRTLGDMDEDLGIHVLNILDDLASRGSPPDMTSDAPGFVEALTRVRDRIPMLRGHADRLIESLSRIADS